MITMLLRLIGPLLIQGSRIQLIIFVLTVFTAVSRSGAGQSCGGEWFIISSENQPRLHRHQLCEWPSWGANRRTLPCCHWMVGDQTFEQCLKNADLSVQITLIAWCGKNLHKSYVFSAHFYQAMHHEQNLHIQFQSAPNISEYKWLLFWWILEVLWPYLKMIALFLWRPVGPLYKETALHW